MNKYPKGSTVKVKWEFREEGQALVDPSNVYFEIKQPNSAIYVYGVGAEIVRTSQGKYYILLTTNYIQEFWAYNIFSSGTSSAYSEELEFFVE